MPILKAAMILFILLSGFAAASAQSATPERPASAKLTPQGLIGAWRLVGIDYSGPNGALADPVFGPNPQGIVIYDQSGWMSVQIVTSNRPAIARPATRTSGAKTPDDAKLAAAAFDTYYAYFGTWDFDADTSVVTQHLKSSLLPYETGLEYRREATLDGAYLKLIARLEDKGEARQRTLIWTRLSDPGLIGAPSAAPMAIAPATSATASPAPPLPQTQPTPTITDPQFGLPRPAHGVATKYGDIPIKYQEAIQQYFLEHMRSPDSVQYQEITKPEQGYTTTVVGAILMREKREYGWTVKATINALNSHDAYVGFKTYKFLFRGERIVDVRLPLPGDEMN